MTLVWVGLACWALSGVVAGGLLWHAATRPLSDLDERMVAVDAAISEWEVSRRRDVGGRW